MEHKLKVTHVIGGGEFGGAEQHIIQILALMPKHQVLGKVICFYEAGLSQALRERGVDVEVLEYGRFDLRTFFALRKSFKRDKPDIIHTHGVKANFLARLACRGLKKAKLVTTVHSLLEFDYPEKSAYFFASLMEKSTRSMNHHFIAVSHPIKDSLVQDGVLSLDITVVHHGIDTNRYGQGLDILRKELSLPLNTYMIGAVTRLVKIKGMEHLVDAMPLILKENALACLVIVGNGPEEESLKKQVAQLGISDRVFFLGFREDIPDCLHSFDCFVSASFSEGLGLNILEAMAADVPVVVTKVGGIVDFMRDRENGLLVMPGSSSDLAAKVIEMMDHRNFAKKLADEGRYRVHTQFPLDSMATNTIHVYEKLLRDHHG